jgi:acetate kinase
MWKSSWEFTPQGRWPQGVRRYGFHGLPYAFLMEELARLAGTAAAQGRIILAHLSNGAGPEFLGIALEEKQNAANAGLISTNASRVAVRVMHTDEDWMIAHTVCRLLALGGKKEI